MLAVKKYSVFSTIASLGWSMQVFHISNVRLVLLAMFSTLAALDACALNRGFTLLRLGGLTLFGFSGHTLRLSGLTLIRLSGWAWFTGWAAGGGAARWTWVTSSTFLAMLLSIPISSLSSDFISTELCTWFFLVWICFALNSWDVVIDYWLLKEGDNSLDIVPVNWVVTLWVISRMAWVGSFTWVGSFVFAGSFARAGFFGSFRMTWVRSFACLVDRHWFCMTTGSLFTANRFSSSNSWACWFARLYWLARLSRTTSVWFTWAFSWFARLLAWLYWTAFSWLTWFLAWFNWAALFRLSPTCAAVIAAAAAYSRSCWGTWSNWSILSFSTQAASNRTQVNNIVVLYLCKGSFLYSMNFPMQWSNIAMCLCFWLSVSVNLSCFDWGVIQQGHDYEWECNLCFHFNFD